MELDALGEGSEGKANFIFPFALPCTLCTVGTHTPKIPH